MNKDAWPFVSIVAWPEGLDREGVAQLLAQARGLDVATLRLRLGQQPPMVLERVEPVAAGEMVSLVAQRGGDAFAFRLEDLAGLGPTLKLKEIRVVEGALDVDLWEGLSTTLPFGRVQFLIRAHLSRTTRVHRAPPGPLRTTPGLRQTWDSVKAEIEASVEHRIQTSDKLELHTADRSVYQVDGDRFSFSVLGDLRGHADKANMDSLTELLGHLCPEAVVDDYFKLWRPPPGYQTLRVPGARAGRPDDAAFTFYSRWVALTYRHVLAVGDG